MTTLCTSVMGTVLPVMMFLLATAGAAHAADCNSNGIDDATEIAAGSGTDCQPDGVLDDCQTHVVYFSDSFAEPELDASKWTSSVGATIDDAATGEPSPPYVLRLDPGSVVESVGINLTNEEGVNFEYYRQLLSTGAGSPGRPDDLVVEFRDSAGQWLELDRHESDAAYGDPFIRSVIALPPAAYHANMAVRFRIDEAYNRYWFIDDVRLALDRDCNANEVPDECDVAAGTSRDCNLNAIPDECEPDCNGNGQPDDCDLAYAHTCCTPAIGPGCSDTTIEACVCAIDPYCCAFNWDRICVGYVEHGECGRCSADCNSNGVLDDCDAGGAVLGTLFPTGYDDIRRFGASVALYRRILIVGAPWSDNQSGAVFMYRHDGAGWHLQHLISAPRHTGGDLFGASIAVDGSRFVVGTPGQHVGDGDPNGYWAGVAYVYRFDQEGNVRLDGYLVPPEPTVLAEYGTAVALKGDLAAIAPGPSLYQTSNPGKVLVYRRSADGWAYEADLAVPGDDLVDFGHAIAIGEGVVTVTDSSDAVHVFREGPAGWTDEATLASPDGHDGFGEQLVFDGEHLLISAPTLEIGGVRGRGAIYSFVFDGGSWSEAGKVTSPEPWAFRTFGQPFIVGGDRLVAHSRIAGSDDGTPTYQVFQRDGAGWRYASSFVPNSASYLYGDTPSISFDGGLLAVGLPSAGAVFLFGIEDDCNSNSILDSCDIAAGYAEDCNGDFKPDACEVSSGWRPDCNDNSVPDECDVVEPGDFNGDGAIDLFDAASLVDCLAGPEEMPAPADAECVETCFAAFDRDDDLDVDLIDFAAFQAMFTGP